MNRLKNQSTITKFLQNDPIICGCPWSFVVILSINPAGVLTAALTV
jgi:hypothetical protein